jgi:hypothetical protein
MGWVNVEPPNRIKSLNNEIPDTVQYAGIFGFLSSLNVGK